MKSTSEYTDVIIMGRPQPAIIADGLRRVDLLKLRLCAREPQIVSRTTQATYRRLAKKKLVIIETERTEDGGEVYECKTAFITALGLQVVDYRIMD